LQWCRPKKLTCSSALSVDADVIDKNNRSHHFLRAMHSAIARLRHRLGVCPYVRLSHS